MYDFKNILMERAINSNESRKMWDKKIDYSYNNYLAINAIGELRLHLYSILIDVPPFYKRFFKCF